MRKTFRERIKDAWDLFKQKEDLSEEGSIYGGVYSHLTSKPYFYAFRTAVTSIYTRIAVDCASVRMNHVKLVDGEFQNILRSPLNRALTIEANLDQSGGDLIKDIVMSMFDESVVAVVPTLTSGDPLNSETFKIYRLRVAKILDWYPESVRVEIYNEKTGNKEQRVLPKYLVAIIENPFSEIMNRNNGTLKRAQQLFSLLDQSNSKIGSNKLDLIIQLPYVIKSEYRKAQANSRKNEIEDQLVNSKYGIAYTDGTEKIVQLNRPIENTLWQQAKDALLQLYNELGMTENIFNGTANEVELTNYYNRTINPIMSAIAVHMERKWIPKSKEEKEGIRYFRDPFKLIPVNSLAEVADKFTRNEIMTSNEIRAVVGLKPSDDPNADKLRNSNLNHAPEDGMTAFGEDEEYDEDYEDDNGIYSDMINDFMAEEGGE